MTKSFSEYERELIKKKLQQSCEECWGRYGYKKTSVGELCKMAAISTGAFYIFYDSKEMLFLDTLNMIHERYHDLIDKLVPKNPTKYDFSATLKHLFRELGKTPWMLNLNQDYEILLRKLPPEYLKENFNNDLTAFNKMLEQFKLKPKVDLDLFISIAWILVLSIPSKTIVGDNYSIALDFIVDSIIEKLF